MRGIRETSTLIRRATGIRIWKRVGGRAGGAFVLGVIFQAKGHEEDA